jgi:hypothetical protein
MLLAVGRALEGDICGRVLPGVPGAEFDAPVVLGCGALVWPPPMDERRD